MDTEEASLYPDEFRSRVMALMYVAKRSRPDILKEVAYLATKVASPSAKDDEKMARFEGYLYKTVEDKLILHPKSLELYGRTASMPSSVGASYSIHWDSKWHSGVVVSQISEGLA
jgi:hypothetical protein